MEVVTVVVGGVLLLAVGVVVGLYVSRQRTLSRRVASFSCALNEAGEGARRWQPGIAQYTRERLVWWRTLSLAPRPARSWSRSDLTLVSRTPLGQADDAGRPLLVVECRDGDETFRVIVSEPAYTGLVSWLESGPRPIRGVI